MLCQVDKKSFLYYLMPQGLRKLKKVLKLEKSYMAYKNLNLKSKFECILVRSLQKLLIKKELSLVESIVFQLWSK